MSEDTSRSLIFNWDYSDHRNILTCVPCRFSKIMIEYGMPSLKCGKCAMDTNIVNQWK
jgi:hypothetical protein